MLKTFEFDKRRIATIQLQSVQEQQRSATKGMRNTNPFLPSLTLKYPDLVDLSVSKVYLTAEKEGKASAGFHGDSNFKMTGRMRELSKWDDADASAAATGGLEEGIEWVSGVCVCVVRG